MAEESASDLIAGMQRRIAERRGEIAEDKVDVHTRFAEMHREIARRRKEGPEGQNNQIAELHEEIARLRK